MTTTTARLRSIHPGWILVVLDLIGLAIASYLSVVELGGGVPVCGPVKGCETVALSEYSKIGGIPVAVFGVILSLIGVIFEVYFLSLQLFVIHAVCIWCTLYGVSLILRFLVAMVIWLRRGRLSARLR
jgi:uncharacterized membrane protein